MYFEITTPTLIAVSEGGTKTEERRHYWRFAIRADYGVDVELRLDCYREESRATRRHKWKLTEEPGSEWRRGLRSWDRRAYHAVEPPLISDEIKARVVAELTSRIVFIEGEKK